MLGGAESSPLIAHPALRDDHPRRKAANATAETAKRLPDRSFHAKHPQNCKRNKKKLRRKKRVSRRQAAQISRREVGAKVSKPPRAAKQAAIKWAETRRPCGEVTIYQIRPPLPSSSPPTRGFFSLPAMPSPSGGHYVPTGAHFGPSLFYLARALFVLMFGSRPSPKPPAPPCALSGMPNSAYGVGIDKRPSRPTERPVVHICGGVLVHCRHGT